MPISRRDKWRLSRAIGLGLGVCLVVWPLAPSADGFDDETAPFSIAFKDEVSAYRDTSAFVMPGSTLSISVASGPPGEYSTETDQGLLARRGLQRWQWTMPEKPGVYKLMVNGPADDDEITLRAFVMVPATRMRNGSLNGYRIGTYPDKPLNDNPMYRPPRGFVEVTDDNQDTKVSPHFRLRQFICKQEPFRAFPKYVVLEERLLLHLEGVLERVNDLGYDADTLHVMSGYRTPHYNALLRDARYSMHQFGGAADVFVDEHEKGVMDDLTRDGLTDLRDARYLFTVVDRMLARPTFRKFEGGMGAYPGTAAHPPFVHIDVRGTRARWEG